MIRLLLSLSLATLGVMKLLGSSGGFLLPMGWLRAIGAAELLCGLILVLGYCRRTIAVSVAALAFLGIAVSFATSTPCGCAGSLVELSPQYHRVLAGLLGCMAVSQITPSPQGTSSTR